MRLSGLNTAAAIGAAAIFMSACSGSTQGGTSSLPEGNSSQPLAQSRSLPSQTNCLTSLCMYVYDQKQGAILIYPSTANGNVKPAKKMVGPYIAASDCGVLDGYCSNNVAVDPKHNVYVASTSTSPPLAAIAMFKSGQYGSVTPERVITGAKTELSFPSSVAVDSKGNINAVNLYYANTCQAEQGNITIYRAGSNGDVAPDVVIGVHYVREVAVDDDGDIYTIGSDSSPSTCQTSIHVYAPVRRGFKLVQDIVGPNTQLNSPTGIAVDSMKNIYVATGHDSSLLMFAHGTTGNVSPSATISGPNTALDEPTGVAVDASGDIYAANLAGPSVTVYPPGSNGNASPSQTLTGGKTTLEAPNSIVVR